MNLPLDMDKPTSSYRVGSCFANPEKGTYFDGTGYAKAGEDPLQSFTDIITVMFICFHTKYLSHTLKQQKHTKSAKPDTNSQHLTQFAKHNTQFSM